MKHIIASFLISFSLISSAYGSENDWICPYIQNISNFPKPGIQFKWYANLLKDPEAFHKTIEAFASRYKEKKLDAIVGLDSRGFIFGSALAYELKIPFVMVRKAGKLPGKVVKIDYSLEYASASFELETDSLKAKDRVLIIDDLLATGGTANAAGSLIEALGAEVVEAAFLIELQGLNGRQNLRYPVFALLSMKADE